MYKVVRPLKKNLSSLSKEKVSELFAQVIDKIGFENALEIARIAGGGNMYIPMVETLERPWIENRIRDEFTGYNFRELALKYNKSESTIRGICKDIVSSKRRQPISGQLTLFEE
jgi:Mor family transcriptional regulator